MKTYEKYLTEIGIGGGSPGEPGKWEKSGPVMISRGDKKGAKEALKKVHIVTIVKRMTGLVKHLEELEKTLKFEDYKEWKKLSSINKNYKKFTDKFVDTYFSRH